MKNVYYILRDELDRAAGDAGSRVRGRGRLVGEDKVVDLAAWKSENLTVPEEPEDGRMSDPGRYGDGGPVRRRRRRPAAALDWAELAATLAVTAAFAALILRVLLF